MPRRIVIIPSTTSVDIVFRQAPPFRAPCVNYSTNDFTEQAVDNKISRAEVEQFLSQLAEGYNKCYGDQSCQLKTLIGLLIAAIVCAGIAGMLKGIAMVVAGFIAFIFFVSCLCFFYSIACARPAQIQKSSEFANSLIARKNQEYIPKGLQWFPGHGYQWLVLSLNYKKSGNANQGQAGQGALKFGANGNHFRPAGMV